jgi:predicted small integral membrane protein
MRTGTRTTGTRSTRPESVIGASGTILFVLSFLPWWGRITTGKLRLGESGRVPSASSNFNAYFGYGWILELAIFLGVGAATLVLGRRASTRGFPRWIYFWIGLSMTVLMLASIIRGPVDSVFEGVARIEVSRGPLVAVGLVPCALITLAGLGFARKQARGRR